VAINQKYKKMFQSSSQVYPLAAPNFSKLNSKVTEYKPKEKVDIYCFWGICPAAYLNGRLMLRRFTRHQFGKQGKKISSFKTFRENDQLRSLVFERFHNRHDKVYELISGTELWTLTEPHRTTPTRLYFKDPQGVEFFWNLSNKSKGTLRKMTLYRLPAQDPVASYSVNSIPWPSRGSVEITYRAQHILEWVVTTALIWEEFAERMEWHQRRGLPL
jgi:hypothetical protein